jgi:hypothetical protein
LSVVLAGFAVFTGIALTTDSAISEYITSFTFPYLAIFFMMLPALEVLKQEDKTQFDRFKLTLPVSRGTIVRSHYLFYLTLVVGAGLLVILLLNAYMLITGNPIENVVMRILPFVFMGLIAGSFAYPCLYLFGANKSDIIIIISVFAAFWIMYWGLPLLTQSIPYLTEIPASLTTVLFVLVSACMYLLSYVISNTMYKKKDF